jgi:hypothetical protein
MSKHKFWGMVRKHIQSVLRLSDKGDGEEIEFLQEKYEMVCSFMHKFHAYFHLSRMDLQTTRERKMMIKMTKQIQTPKTWLVVWILKKRLILMVQP